MGGDGDKWVVTNWKIRDGRTNGRTKGKQGNYTRSTPNRKIPNPPQASGNGRGVGQQSLRGYMPDRESTGTQYTALHCGNTLHSTSTSTSSQAQGEDRLRQDPHRLIPTLGIIG